MLDQMLSIIAPHHCCSCDRVGRLLCCDCKNYITRQRFSACVVCAGASHDISRHQLPYQRIYCVGWRKGTLGVVIDQLKFQRAWAAHKQLAELLDETMLELDPKTIVVPIPTAPSHIRQRGYDHMLLIGRELAKRRKLNLGRPIRRKNSLTQHFAPNLEARRRQAKTFFELAGPIDTDAHYLLIDDIFTTGSTLKEAAQLLSDAGATNISCAVIARATQS